MLPWITGGLLIFFIYSIWRKYFLCFLFWKQLGWEPVCIRKVHTIRIFTRITGLFYQKLFNLSGKQHSLLIRIIVRLMSDKNACWNENSINRIQGYKSSLILPNAANLMTLMVSVTRERKSLYNDIFFRKCKLIKLVF